MARLGVFAFLLLPLLGAVTVQAQTCESIQACNTKLEGVAFVDHTTGSYIAVNETVWRDSCQLIAESRTCLGEVTNCGDVELAFARLAPEYMNSLLCDGLSFTEYEKNTECLVDINDQTEPCHSALADALESGISCGSFNDYASCYSDVMTATDTCSDSARDATIDAIRTLVQVVFSDCDISGGPVLGASWHLVAMVAVAGMTLLAI